MKKTIALVLALSLMLTLSCSAMAELVFTTGGTSGTYYAYGNVLAQYITNNTNIPVTAVAGNGSAANIDLLDLGDSQLGFVQNDVANYAYNGIRFEQYEGMPVDTFSALAALYAETVQVVTCNPEIKTIADLKGKNVSIGALGSGVYYNAIDVLGVYGMSEEDILQCTDPFFTTKKSGVGMGLALTKQYVKENNGQLEIESVLGEYTRMRMIFKEVTAYEADRVDHR